MGVDFDFKSQIINEKLTASQYQQPITELDLVTESTESTDLQALMQILNLVQGRLRERFNATQQLVSLMIEMNEDRRLFITFLGPQPEPQITNNLIGNQRQMPRIQRVPIMNLQRRMRERQQQHNQRQHQFQEELDRRINRSPQRRNLDLFGSFQRSRDTVILEPIETESQTISVVESSENNNQNLHAFSLSQQSQQRNVIDPIIPDHQNQSILQSDRNQKQFPSRSIEVGNDQTLNQIHLNQNSQRRPKIRKQQQQIDQPTSCWSFLTRFVRNIFRNFS